MAETVSINYEGVAPWLLCRRMLPEDHHRRLRGIIEHVKKALDLPVPSDSPSAAAFLSSRNREAEFGYRDLVHLTQLLDEDCKSQGLLRQTFGTAESRHWRRLKKTFRSDNLHAADVSREVLRRANVLVPALQKELQTLRKMSTDCQRRKDQLLAGAAASRSAFEGLCGEFEISPETAESAEASALEAQLERHVLRALPSAFGRAQSAIAPHADALVALYRRFALHNGAEGSWAEGDAPLALLLVFAKEGNVSLECLAKRLPSSELLQREVRVLQEEQMLSRDALGIRLEGGGEDAAFSEAQKDREETVAAAETHCADREAKDFPSAESGSLNELRRQLLLRPVCRRQILDDLLELQAFLLVRAQQRHSNRQFSLPDELQSSEAQLREWAEAVRECLEELEGKKTAQLLAILHSPKTIHRLLEELLEARGKALKPLGAARRQDELLGKLKEKAIQRIHTMEAVGRPQVAQASEALLEEKKKLKAAVAFLESELQQIVGARVKIVGIPAERLGG